MAQIDVDCPLTRGSEHVETLQNGQTLAMSLKHGKYFALRDTAQRIWDLLETPRSPRQLAKVLSDEYDVEADACLADLGPFLADLKSFGLITEHPR
ncbi:MAG: PqqD family peptide modification chaperone [Pseudomonadota bacterium]